MAKVKSHLFSIMRGSVGGINYTANQYHQIIARNRTSPVNPRTNKQSMVRSSFSEALAQWVNLSISAQTAWNDWASLVTFTGPLGEYQISGRNAFIMHLAPSNYLRALPAPDHVASQSVPAVYGMMPIGWIQQFAPSDAGTGIDISVVNDDDYEKIALVTLSPVLISQRRSYQGPWSTAEPTKTVIVASSATLIKIRGLEEDRFYAVRLRFLRNDGVKAGISAEYIYIIQALTYTP